MSIIKNNTSKLFKNASNSVLIKIKIIKTNIEYYFKLITSI